MFGETQGWNHNNKSPTKKLANDKSHENEVGRCSRCGRRDYESSNCSWNTDSYFSYGQKRHKIVDCPQRNESRSTQIKDGGQKSRTQRRVYALTQ